jgi:hypothetical protein
VVMLAVATELASCSTAHSEGPSRKVATTQGATVPTTAPPINNTARLTMSSNTWAVGSPITVEGSDCPAGDYGSVSLSQTSPVQWLPFHDAGFVSGNAGPDHRWQLTGLVPMMYLGSVQVGAWCHTPTSRLFAYPPTSVTVTTADTVNVSPGTTVRAGTASTVTSAEACQGTGAPEAFLSNLGDTAMGGSFLASRDSEGRIGFPVTVVAPSSPGAYQLVTVCSDYHGDYEGVYEPVTISVS